MEQGTFISNKYKNDKYSMIVETKEDVKKLKYEKENYLMFVHCNGCFKKCSLSNANCGRGKNLNEKFLREE